MPSGSITTDSINNGVQLSLAGDFGSVGFISADATAASYSSNVISGFGDQQSVTVAGGALAAFSSAIYMSGDSATVQVLQSGQVSNTNLGATEAVSMQGSRANMINQGLISGGTGVEVYMGGTATGDLSQVVNHGTISGNGFGQPADQYSNEGYGVGIRIDGGNYEMGIERDDANIVNTGTVSGAYQNGDAPGYAILLTSYYNGGEFGEEVFDSEDSAVAVNIANSGQLMGDVRVLSQDDTLENSGEIHGNVYMGLGDDWVDSRGGQVQGTVFGDDGDDTIIGGEHSDVVSGGGDDDSIVGLDGADDLSGASGEDTIGGGAGDDTIDGGSNNDELRGGSGDDYIDGNSGADDIRGESGDDTIFGGSASDTIDGGSGEENIDGGSSADMIFGRSGDDFIRGDSGSDTISGGADNDTISGGTGNDDINGGSGNDRIFSGADDDTVQASVGDDYVSASSGDDSVRGGSGNDTIDGGSGEDTLSGGTGEDTFVFGSVSDSPHGATRDTITDFEAGVDTIDLSEFTGLSYIGGAGYSGTAGEVRYNGAVGRLYIDVDGDSASDFSIDLIGNPALTADDLIL